MNVVKIVIAQLESIVSLPHSRKISELAAATKRFSENRVFLLHPSQDQHLLNFLLIKFAELSMFGISLCLAEVRTDEPKSCGMVFVLKELVVSANQFCKKKSSILISEAIGPNKSREIFLVAMVLSFTIGNLAK